MKRRIFRSASVFRSGLGSILIGFRSLLAFGLAIVLVFGCFHAPALALTQEQRLLSEVWRIVDRSYVDDTFNHQNWWLARQKALQQPLLDREQTYTAIQKLLASLDDPFTRLLKPDQYRSLQTNTSGELTGVGLQISQDDDGNLRVISPIEGSPAEKAGIKPRDRILKINGFPTKTLTLDDAAERMRGAIGSKVSLTIASDEDATQEKEILLLRDRISLNPVYADLRVADSRISEESPASNSALATGTGIGNSTGTKIGYIRLSQFNANASTEVANAIRRLESQGAEAYVLDLRGNPGGLLQAGIEIAKLWLAEGTIVYTVNRNGIQDSFTAMGEALTDDPLVVLVNQGTASASEILAGALQDNNRAQLIGERTFGKGLIQSLFNLSDGSGLAVTIAKYETPNHHDINRLGIPPDITIPLDPISRDEVATAADRQYQAAVEALVQESVVAGAT